MKKAVAYHPRDGTSVILQFAFCNGHWTFSDRRALPHSIYNTPVRELDLLQHIYSRNAALPSRVTIPPGDDMGAVTIGGVSVLITVDQIAEGVHFLSASTPIASIARKAITRNLSDVAAMGAVPCAAVVAGCLPRSFGEAKANAMFDAMRAVAMGHDCPLIGGDISIWDHPMLLSVTVLAETQGIDPILRSGAKVGDVICVSGTLGGSLVELDDPPGYVHHLDFEPRLKLGRKLASDAAIRPRCMMDLSDGLGKDLAHICRAGEGGVVGAELWVDKLPISRAAHVASQRDGLPPWQHALGDGEDYELLFVVSPQVAEKLPYLIEGVPITQVGRITKRSGDEIIMLKMPDGSVAAMGEHGWEHRGDVSN